MSKGAVTKKSAVREIEGIPGTVTHGFKEQPIIEQRMPENVVRSFRENGIDPATMKIYTMGVCSIFVGHEPAAADGSLLWHMTISTPSRHPTWDEIKVARYRLLPLDLCFAIMLPQPQYYVNVPEQDHVFQVWEVQDPEAAVDSGMSAERESLTDAPRRVAREITFAADRDPMFQSEGGDGWVPIARFNELYDALVRIRERHMGYFGRDERTVTDCDYALSDYRRVGRPS